MQKRFQTDDSEFLLNFPSLLDYDVHSFWHGVYMTLMLTWKILQVGKRKQQKAMLCEQFLMTFTSLQNSTTSCLFKVMLWGSWYFVQCYAAVGSTWQFSFRCQRQICQQSSNTLWSSQTNTVSSSQKMTNQSLEAFYARLF